MPTAMTAASSDVNSSVAAGFVVCAGARRGASSDSSDVMRLLLAEAALVPDCKLCERGNQFCSMCTLNDGLIAEEFAVECHSRSGKPDERMEPQGTQRKFVE
jgi:hypothetical protein